MEKFPTDSGDSGGDQFDVRVDTNQEEIKKVESILQSSIPVDYLLKIFGQETYLIGGSVRDTIMGKGIYNSDLDLMTRSSMDDILINLQNLGFTESKEGKFVEHKFSIKKDAGIINLLVDNKEIQVGLIGSKNIDELISTGDVNLNCCVFDIGSLKIINPDKFREIENKELYFCNPELAKEDPMKIMSALKQISRIPDLILPEETLKIIEDSVPNFLDFFAKNPDKIYKLMSLFSKVDSDDEPQVLLLS